MDTVAPEVIHPATRSFFLYCVRRIGSSRWAFTDLWTTLVNNASGTLNSRSNNKYVVYFCERGFHRIHLPDFLLLWCHFIIDLQFAKPWPRANTASLSRFLNMTNVQVMLITLEDVLLNFFFFSSGSPEWTPVGPRLAFPPVCASCCSLFCLFRTIP